MNKSEDKDDYVNILEILAFVGWALAIIFFFS